MGHCKAQLTGVVNSFMISIYEMRNIPGSKAYNASALWVGMKFKTSFLIDARGKQHIVCYGNDQSFNKTRPVN